MPAVRKRKISAETDSATGKRLKSSATRPGKDVEPISGSVKEHKGENKLILTARENKGETDIDFGNGINLDNEKSQITKTRSAGKRGREEDHLATPQNKRFKDAIPPTPAETPTRGARNLLDRLNLVPSNKPNTPSRERTNNNTLPLTPQSSSDEQIEDYGLPESSRDLLRLFSSFVNATSIYLAHHKSTPYAPMSELLPLVTKSWKVRSVSLEDLRKLLAVLGERYAPFELVDHGEGLIRLEQKEHGETNRMNPRNLGNRFEKSLERSWNSWNGKTGNDADDWVMFSRNLPLIAISKSEMMAEAPKQNKRHDRLDQFKKDILESRAQEASSKNPSVPAQQKTSSAVSSRGSSLLDRIMAKQQLTSTRPNGPTHEEMDRRAALDRIEEIAMVLDILGGGRPRISFSMQMLVQHLQNSLRNPISREEAERSLGLMAGQITPSFVSLIHTGTVHGVVISRGGKLSNTELRRRVEAA